MTEPEPVALTEPGWPVDLSHADRLALAAAFRMCSEDSGPRISTVLRAWCDDLGRQTPVLYVASLGGLTRADFDDLFRLLGSPLFANRVVRTCCSVAARQGVAPDVRPIAAWLRTLAPALARQRLTAPDTPPTQGGGSRAE